MHALPLDLHVALLGNPNCGKTALFNLLTGRSTGSRPCSSPDRTTPGSGDRVSLPVRIVRPTART